MHMPQASKYMNMMCRASYAAVKERSHGANEPAVMQYEKEIHIHVRSALQKLEMVIS